MELPSLQYRYTTNFELFFKVLIIHNYYKNGQCRDLTIKPTTETIRKIKGYNIIFKPQNDGFILALNQLKDYSKSTFLKPETFDFEFKIKNPTFLKFTDLPYESSQFHVFDNLIGDEGRMHPEKYVNEKTCQSIDNDGLAGVIRVQHTPENPLFFNSTEEKKNKAKLHYIHFNNRKVRIKYYFYGNNELTNYLQFVNIENVNNINVNHIFTKPQEITLRNGANGFVVTTIEEVELNEDLTDYWIIKKDKGGGSPFEYKKVLPLPRPESVVYDSSVEGFISEIFVKL